jgi:glycosyltransferase involved in cell wall biosynthesis
VQQICAEAGLPLDRLPVVHDGVDPLRLQQGERIRGRTALGLGGQVPLLLTVAKLTDHKGHRFLLDALPAVLWRFPQTVLALAGDGPQMDALRSQARRLKLDRHVRFLGFRQDVPDLMAAADLLVVPSHLEGLCSSVIDAMFVGCPVVATRAGGLPDLLQAAAREEDAGWLVPPRDSAALATAVSESLSSPEKRRCVAARAKVRARRHFSAATMVERTISAYGRLQQLKPAHPVGVRTTSAIGELVSGTSRSQSTC